MSNPRRWLASLALSALLVSGCAGKAINVVDDRGPTSPSDGAPAGDGSEVKPDSGTPSPDTMPEQASALQVVVNSLTLPKNADEYAKDLDGRNGDDNQLGAIIGIMALIPGSGFDFQGSIQQMFAEGSFIMLMDVLAGSIADAQAMNMLAFLGLDQDFPANPADDFSGNEEFLVDPSSPPGLNLAGTINAGKLSAGPGTLVIPIPLGDTPVNVTITSAYATADVSAAGMINGQINGAIPWNEVDGKIIPNLADLLNPMYNDLPDGDFLKGILRDQFDYQAGSEGVITPDEIRNSPLLGMVLKADVDTDGDGADDAMSLGVAFTAVPCKITM